MQEQYYNELESKLSCSLIKAQGKMPHNTQLQLTKEQLEDLLILWQKYALVEFNLVEDSLLIAGKHPTQKKLGAK